jgi:hypothetical protein
MFVTTKYEIEINDFTYIPANTKLEVIKDWNEYSGCITVKYNGESYYFNELYFNIPVIA